MDEPRLQFYLYGRLAVVGDRDLQQGRKRLYGYSIENHE